MVTLDFQKIEIIKISGIAHDGRGIGFLSGNGRGKLVFVPDSLPGQTIKCKVIEEKKNFCEASLIEILNSDSAKIQEPICTHHKICGGCPIQQLPYPNQLQWKQKLIFDAIKKIGHINNLDQIWTKLIPSVRLKHFRNKIELAFGTDENGNLIIGYRKKKSHEVFNLNDCAIIPAEIISFIKEFKNLAQNFSSFDGKNGLLRFIVFRQTLNPLNQMLAWKILLITSRLGKKQKCRLQDIARTLINKFDDIIGFVLEERFTNDYLAIGQRRVFCLNKDAKEDIEGSICSLPAANKLFKFDISSFFQVNSFAAENLASLVLETYNKIEHPGNIIDLYCGVGFPGLIIPTQPCLYEGIEINPMSVKFAKINSTEFNLNNNTCNFNWITGDLNKYSGQKNEHGFQTCLTDPPRSGLSKNNLNFIKDQNISNIIYISCNPSTMARDLNLLKENYKLTTLAAIDMFPHTMHVECCGLLQKIK